MVLLVVVALRGQPASIKASQPTHGNPIGPPPRRWVCRPRWGEGGAAATADLGQIARPRWFARARGSGNAHFMIARPGPSLIVVQARWLGGPEAGAQVRSGRINTQRSEMAVLAESEAIIHDAERPSRARAAGWRQPTYETVGKRVLDLVLASLVLLAALPAWLLVAVAIRLETRGPVFFVQERIGLGGSRFRFYKFRSMHVDAERRLAQLRALNEVSGPVFKIRRDPRITRVGRILRRTSLDELPQLVNVIRGEMSLVGPRPALPQEVAVYQPGDLARLTVKPGLTCLWQVSGRSTVGFARWMEYDREYVARMSLRLDLEILLRTVWAVLSCRGAY